MWGLVRADSDSGFLVTGQVCTPARLQLYLSSTSTSHQLQQLLEDSGRDLSQKLNFRVDNLDARNIRQMANLRQEIEGLRGKLTVLANSFLPQGARMICTQGS